MGRNRKQRRGTGRRARAWTGGAGALPSRRPPRRPSPSARATADEVADEVLRAVELLRTYSGEGAEAAVGRVVLNLRTPVGAGLVARRLHVLLTDCVARAWELGWQPADLYRLVGRRLDHRAQLVLADAMAHHLSRFAEATIAPHWAAQLRDAGAAGTWWSRDSDPVTARGVVDGHGPDAVVTAALRVVALLTDLPRLQRLDPLPGEARRPASTPRPDVEERVLARVRALLAKAESTTFEAEAETFTAGAQALMARYSIDIAMLQEGGERAADAPSARRIGIDRPYERPKLTLLDAVARANRCRTVWSSALGFATVVGFEPDLVATEAIFTSLLVQATTALSEEGRRATLDGRSRTRTFRRSFLTAFAVRVGVRLREVTEEETAAATRGDPSGDTCNGPGPAEPGRGVLVRVLARRAGEVDACLAEMFPRVTTMSMARTTDLEGWCAGTGAADRADLLGHRRPLEQGRSA